MYLNLNIQQTTYMPFAFQCYPTNPSKEYVLETRINIKNEKRDHLGNKIIFRKTRNIL